MNQKLIKQFISYIDKERKFSKHTMRNYQNDLEQFDSFLSKYDEKLTFLSIDKTAIIFLKVVV